MNHRFINIIAMKKLFSLLLAALMLFSVSCGKNDNPGEGNDGDEPVNSGYGVDGVTPLPEAVDLGLPSGLKWASFNLGASNPYENGDYYAWGETITYYSSLYPVQWAKRNETDENGLHFDWESYLYANGAGTKLTKYCPKEKKDYWDATAKPEGPDGEITLLLSDDVAHVKLGGKWRMPTEDDIRELFALKAEAAKEGSDYTWEWMTIIIDNGLNDTRRASGVRITRKSTEATLFLPAAGECRGAVIDWNLDGKMWGVYWSSSANWAEPCYAYGLCFSSGDSDWAIFHSSRCWGCSVRPVSE